MANGRNNVVSINGRGKRKVVRRQQALPADLMPFSLGNLSNEGPIEVLHDLPPDLMPRRIRDYGVEGKPGGGVDASNEYLASIANSTGILASTAVLNRGLIGRTVTVGITPTLLVRSQFLKGYMFLNPSQIIGVTSFGTLLVSGTQTSNGNIESSSLGVANFRDMHLFLDVTAVSGATPTLDIIAQAYDPASAKWADTQALWSGINSTGISYSNPGGLGIATDFSIRWVVSGGASFTFSIGYVLKDGLPGSEAGIAKSIYLGGPGVSVSSGFPLLEGQSRSWYMNENTELWGIASTALDIKIFEL